MDIGFLIVDRDKPRNLQRGVISSYSPVENEIQHFVGKKITVEGTQIFNDDSTAEKLPNTADAQDSSDSQQEITMVSKLDHHTQPLESS